MIRAAFALFCAALLAGCTDGEPLTTATGATPASVAPGVAPPTASPQAGAVAGANPAAIAPATGGRRQTEATRSGDLEPRPPVADPYDLAQRLRGQTVTPEAKTQPPAAAVGDKRDFWTFDLNAPKAIQIRATLLAQTEHADFWVQEGQRGSAADAERAGRQFEEEIYPKVTAAFGLPAPAADGSPGRISILHMAIEGAGGYFASDDQLPRALAPYSNEQQIIYIDLRQARLGGGAGYAGLVAHEFQHLVHRQGSPAADTWINEGLSEVADELLGGGNQFLRRFETAADTQLTAWPVDESAAASYGAAHSFLRYLLRRYGGVGRARDLILAGNGGVNSVERYLRDNGFGVGFADVFADWTVANLLDEDTGRYSQPEISHRTRDIFKLLPVQGRDATVRQFGTRYYQVEPKGKDVTFRFDGDERVDRLGAGPVSGRALWWSGRGDSMDTTLTREFDLSGVRAATLRFKLWHDIEKDYDYAYVTASRDGGRTWQLLRGGRMTDRDPLRVSFGPGYSDKSGDDDEPAWTDESIDLTPYAGGRVLLRFEYVTDEATAADGLAIDDITITEIGYRDDAESDGGWQAHGFVRVAEPLPQRFIVQLVEEGDGGPTVRRLNLDSANAGEIVVPGSAKRATLVVSGATLGTNTPAKFRVETRQP